MLDPDDINPKHEVLRLHRMQVQPDENVWIFDTSEREHYRTLTTQTLRLATDSGHQINVQSLAHDCGEKFLVIDVPTYNKDRYGNVDGFVYVLRASEAAKLQTILDSLK